MSDEAESLRRELEAARARIARLEQEAETNRSFFARSLAQANALPQRGSGPNVWHAVCVVIGIAIGIILVLALVAARAQPTVVPTPLPPVRAEVELVAPPHADAGKAAPMTPDAAVPVAAAPAPAPSGAAVDDSGSLNITASSAAVVFVDGKRVGPAPVHGYAVKPGEHVVRVVCASDAGQEEERKLSVPAFADVDVEHRCE